MGTCVSKSKKTRRRPPRHSAKGPAAEQDAASRNPPEEEKVKEVLSETPKLNLPPRTIEKVRPFEKEKPIEKERPIEKQAAEKPHPPSPEKIPVPLEEESFEVSETVSMSETASAAVTEDSTATEVQQPSHRGQFVNRREDRHARKSASPARRREASPGRRMEGVGPRPVGRAVSAGRDGRSPAGERRNVVRRFGGEVGPRSNGPRSRSPATRGDTGGRPAVNRSGSRRVPQSPSRGPASATKDQGQNLRDDVGGGGGGGVGGGGKEGERDMKPQEQSGSAPNESLENPLVALECFIFL
ncbi:unnamed protein product [Victoria cruziana]